MAPLPLDSAARIVQTALTPIFLLTGVAQLLNVCTTRLGRVADRVDLLMRDSAAHPVQLRRLRLRSRILDVAVVLAALAGGLTCCAGFVLFVAAPYNATAGAILLGVFGAALACAMGALTAFACETILSGQSMRELAERGTEGDAAETPSAIGRP